MVHNVFFLKNNKQTLQNYRNQQKSSQSFRWNFLKLKLIVVQCQFNLFANPLTANYKLVLLWSLFNIHFCITSPICLETYTVQYIPSAIWLFQIFFIYTIISVIVPTVFILWPIFKKWFFSFLVVFILWPIFKKCFFPF